MLHLGNLTIILLMTKEYFIKKAGSQKELAALLGINQAAVSQWKDVPKMRIWQLKVLRPEWFEEIQ
jgi:DNA-binding transcriptional regulator Cro